MSVRGAVDYTPPEEPASGEFEPVFLEFGSLLEESTTVQGDTEFVRFVASLGYKLELPQTTQRAGTICDNHSPGPWPYAGSPC